MKLSKHFPSCFLTSKSKISIPKSMPKTISRFPLINSPHFSGSQITTIISISIDWIFTPISAKRRKWICASEFPHHVITVSHLKIFLLDALWIYMITLSTCPLYKYIWFLKQSTRPCISFRLLPRLLRLNVHCKTFSLSLWNFRFWIWKA